MRGRLLLFTMLAEMVVQPRFFGPRFVGGGAKFRFVGVGDPVDVLVCRCWTRNIDFSNTSLFCSAKEDFNKEASAVFSREPGELVRQLVISGFGDFGFISYPGRAPQEDFRTLSHWYSHRKCESAAIVRPFVDEVCKWFTCRCDGDGDGRDDSDDDDGNSGGSSDAAVCAAGDMYSAAGHGQGLNKQRSSCRDRA